VIQKIFDLTGKELLRKILSEKIQPGMTRKQQRQALRDAENDPRLKKFIISWRIRPRVVEAGVKKQICETLETYEKAKKRLLEVEVQVDKKEFVSPKRIPTVSQACNAWLKRKKGDAKRDGGALEAIQPSTSTRISLRTTSNLNSVIFRWMKSIKLVL
jgi:hypothetical protein